jgi:hypothetical protein
MHIQYPQHQHVRRQGPDPLGVPTDVSGINTNAATVATQVVSTGGLQLNTNSAGGESVAPTIGLVPTAGDGPITITASAASLPASTAADASPSSTSAAAPVASASHSSVSLGAVVGACVGSIIGLGLLVLLVTWCNRRDREAKAELESRRSKTAEARNAQGEQGRRRSRALPGGAWDKLGSQHGHGDDGSSRYSAQDPGASDPEKASMNMTAMFKGSASEHSASTHADALRSPPADANYFNIDPSMLSKYHPHLAEEMSMSTTGPQAPGPRPLVGRLDTSGAVSWDGETAADSFASLKSMRMSGTMSPSVSAKATPAVTAGFGRHQWESAEVVTPENGSAYGDDDGAGEAGSPRSRRGSISNPFFSAQERVKAHNPFDDLHEHRPPMPVPVPGIAHHAATDSNASEAMKSLIAALELPGAAASGPAAAEEADLHRVTSMQPSIVSHASTIAYAEEVIPAFPLPPHAEESR